MGTNYYLHTEVCPCCKYAKGVRHIGKSSAGWCFSLHVYPDEGIRDLDDWKREWAKGEIRNEYGETRTAQEMEAVITQRSHPHKMTDERALLHGYKSKAEFMERNYAADGPSNLLRCRIAQDTSCIGHGAGTWDLIAGEFS